MKRFRKKNALFDVVWFDSLDAERRELFLNNLYIAYCIYRTEFSRSPSMRKMQLCFDISNRLLMHKDVQNKLKEFGG